VIRDVVYATVGASHLTRRTVADPGNYGKHGAAGDDTGRAK
jgi:hypothetical protein